MSRNKMSLKELMGREGALWVRNGKVPEARSYIDGEWWDGFLRPPLSVLNPTSQNVLGTIRECNNNQIDIAFSAARKAQKYWQHQVSVLERREALDRFGHLLEDYRADLTLLIAQEMGKTAYTADADITETIHAAEHYRDIAHLALAGEFREAQLPNKVSITKRVPYGTVLAIKPWNFLALNWWTACAAVAAGNAVVLKPSEDIPFLVNASVVLFHQAMKDTLGEKWEKIASLVQVLQGRGEETVGDYAARYGNYDVLSFTGGTDTAAILSRICGERQKKFHKESGGHAAIVVLDDFDLEKAANEIVQAAFGDAGQRCVSCKVVFCQNTIYDDLLARVVEKAKALRIGDPANVETKIGPIINSKQCEGIADQLRKTKEQLGRGALLGGMGFRSRPEIKQTIKSIFNVGEELACCDEESRNFLTPTIFTDVPYGVCAMDEEIFGPVLCFNKVTGADRREVLEKAIDLINQSPYGLSNAMLTRDIGFAMQAAEYIDTGILYIGRGTTGAEVPGYFTGTKASGNGHEAYGIEEYTYVRQVWVDYHPTTRLAQTGGAEKIKKGLRKAVSLF